MCLFFLVFSFGQIGWLLLVLLLDKQVFLPAVDCVGGGIGGSFTVGRKKNEIASLHE